MVLCGEAQRIATRQASNEKARRCEQPARHARRALQNVIIPIVPRARRADRRNASRQSVEIPAFAAAELSSVLIELRVEAASANVRRLMRTKIWRSEARSE